MASNLLDFSSYMNYFFNLLYSNPILISFFAGFFLGEVGILTLAFLSSQGVFSFWMVFIFIMLGEIVSDNIYFSLARIKYFKRILNIKRASYVFEKVDRFVSRISKDNLFLILLYSKFVYGTRIAIIAYLGLKNKNKLKFFIWDSIALLIIVSILFSVGYFSGVWFSMILNSFKNIELAITAVIIILIIFLIIQKRFSDFLSSKRK